MQLAANPKGKPVQRLASMSGGERSFVLSLLSRDTVLLYAFNEVDVFLDGTNVERLAKMIKRQSQQAQFFVLSLRELPMEASERTIRVTQAREAHAPASALKMAK